MVYYNLTYTIFFGNLFWSSRTNPRHFCAPQKQDSKYHDDLYINKYHPLMEKKLKKPYGKYLVVFC